MRNNRNAGTKGTAINALLSQLAKSVKTAPSKAEVGAAQAVTKFLAVTNGLRKVGALPEVRGLWMSAESPFKWGDVSGDTPTNVGAAAILANAKTHAKSVFVKGNRVMVHLKDLAA